MALSDSEGERVARLMAEDKTILMMANHGVLAVGETIAAASTNCIFERAAETLHDLLCNRQELRIVSDAVARLTEQQWRGYGQLAVDHLEKSNHSRCEERRIGASCLFPVAANSMSLRIAWCSQCGYGSRRRRLRLSLNLRVVAPFALPSRFGPTSPPPRR